jgi:Methyltransferase domain
MCRLALPLYTWLILQSPHRSRHFQGLYPRCRLVHDLVRGAAAERGGRVTSLDGSPAAIADLNRRANESRLPITGNVTDLRDITIDAPVDCIVCIGLLMFFPEEVAFNILTKIRQSIKPNGVCGRECLCRGNDQASCDGPGTSLLVLPKRTARFLRRMEDRALHDGVLRRARRNREAVLHNRGTPPGIVISSQISFSITGKTKKHLSDYDDVQRRCRQ